MNDFKIVNLSLLSYLAAWASFPVGSCHKVWKRGGGRDRVTKTIGWKTFGWQTTSSFKHGSSRYLLQDYFQYFKNVLNTVCVNFSVLLIIDIVLHLSF